MNPFQLIMALFLRRRVFRSTLRPSTRFTYPLDLELSSKAEPNGSGQKEYATLYHAASGLQATLSISDDSNLWRDPTCHAAIGTITVLNATRVTISGVQEQVWYVEGFAPPAKGSQDYRVFFGLSSHAEWFGKKGNFQACSEPIYMGVSHAGQEAPYQHFLDFSAQNIHVPAASKRDVSHFFAKYKPYLAMRKAILSLRY